MKVGLHQLYVRSPLLFAPVSSEARSGLPSEFLYAEDLDTYSTNNGEDW